ncbi:hypothetical protein B0H14DRAFT_2585077 [Mycena olivaceomarginata]|nr:hypothetical protein B0H14DRAFT_2585077 [Mycena olivaceomarginata]
MSSEQSGAEDDWQDDPNDDLNLEEGESKPTGTSSSHWSNKYPGFLCNPVFVILLTISMLAFVRNRATNVLPLLLGLFFKISGTSSQVVQMLSNTGISHFDVEPFTEADLAEQLALRGQRANAKSTDILPTPEDDQIIGQSFIALITEMIVAFTPGNSRWKDRKDISAAVAAMMPKDQPLPPYQGRHPAIWIT